MRSIFASFWFWLLIISLITIIIAALIVAANKKTTNWSWALFTIGIVLAVLAIIFGLIEAFWVPSCGKKKIECPPLVYQDECQFDRMNACNSPKITSCNSPTIMSPRMMSPSCNSPTCYPSRANINLPQAQRGFIATSNNLSSLAPSP
jgi:MFS family permease